MKIISKKNSNMALLVLVAAFVGMMLTFPLRDNFIGGLCLSFFIAGVVGGLADWFAVCALFSKPLGIPFRTAIIPRNREKILAAIAKMVGEDLLAVANLKAYLDKYSITGVLLHYFKDEQCKKKFVTISVKIIINALEVINPKLVIKYLLNVTIKKVKSFETNLILANAIEWTVTGDYFAKIVSLSAAELGTLTEKKWFEDILSYFVAEIKQSYEKDMEGRKLLTALAEDFGGFSTAELTERIKEKVGELLLEMADTNKKSQVVTAMEKKLLSLAVKVRTDRRAADAINSYVYEYLHSNEETINNFLLNKAKLYLAKFVDIDTDESKCLYFVEKLEKLLLYISKEETLQNKIDKWLKNMLLVLAEKYHKKVGQLIYDRLDKFTDKMLVNFIEEKVGNDLQMIRINGTVVGGAVGAATYLLNYFL